MTDQMLLLDAGAARAGDPDTSQRAAAAQRGGVRPKILEAFLAHGPMCDDELCAALPEFYAPTVKTARSRLSNERVLFATGEDRDSVRGHAQRVWSLSPRRVETVHDQEDRVA